MATPNSIRRLYSETVRLNLKIGEGQHTLDVSLAYDRPGGTLREVNFVGRGKIGHGLDLMLHDLGIQLSRAIQHRNPDTGEQIA